MRWSLSKDNGWKYNSGYTTNKRESSGTLFLISIVLIQLNNTLGYDIGMESAKIYRRNKQVGVIILAIIWGVLIAGLIIINVTLNKLADSLGIERGSLRLILNMLVILAFAIATIYYVISWDKIALYVRDDALVVQKFFSKKRMSFRNITSVEVRQGFIGNKYNYGTIVISFQSSEPNFSMALIENAHELSKEIKSRSTISSQSVRVVPS